MAIADQPLPVATSATRAPPACSRAWTSGTRGSQSCVSRWRKSGRLAPSWATETPS